MQIAPRTILLFIALAALAAASSSVANALLAQNLADSATRLAAEAAATGRPLAGDMAAAARQGMVLNYAATAMWLVVGSAIMAMIAISILRPLRRTTAAMSALAAGDLAVQVLDNGRRDEIGEIARAVEVFRTGAIERRRLEEHEKAGQARREARQARLEALAGDFERAVAGLLEAATTNAGTMTGMSDALTGNAEEARQRSTTVLAATEMASANVDVIASANSRMVAAIEEIGNQAASSAQGDRFGLTA